MDLRHTCKLFVAMAALLGLNALAPSAASATTTPAPGYGQFTGCPNPAQIPSIEICFHTVFTSGGKFQVGGVEFPIVNPITYSGGLTPSFEVDFNAAGACRRCRRQFPAGSSA